MIYQASPQISRLQRQVRVGDGAGRCWCSGPFVNGTWFARVKSLWHFLGSDPLEPAAVLEMQELPNPHFPILPKNMISRSSLNNVTMILLRQGNVSHSQEMINSLCSSVLASRCTLSTGPYRSYQVLSPAATVTEEIAPRKTRRLCRWHDFTL